MCRNTRVVTIRRLERICTTSQAFMENAWNVGKNVIPAVDGGKGLERRRDSDTHLKKKEGTPLEYINDHTKGKRV